MNKIVKYTTLSILLASTLVASTEQEAKKLKMENSALYEMIKDEGKKELKKEMEKDSKKKVQWWDGTSFMYPMGDEILLKSQGTLGFTKNSGNINGEVLNISADIALRKKRFTAGFLAQVKKTDTVDFLDSEIDNVDLRVNTYFQYDLALATYSEAGHIWERLDSQALEDRHIIYAGVGQFLPLDAINGFIKLFAAVGTQNDKYDTSDVGDTFGYDSRNTALTYLNQTLVVPLGKKVTFIQDLIYFYDLEKSDEMIEYVKEVTYVKSGEQTNRQRFQLYLGLDMKITDHVSFAPSFVYRRDSNPFPILTNSDKVYMANIKFSY